MNTKTNPRLGAHFFGGASALALLHGNKVVFAPETGGGSGGSGVGEGAGKAAEAGAGEAGTGAGTGAAGQEGGEGGKARPTDEEAKLLREVMGFKEKAKKSDAEARAAAEEKAALETQIKELLGLEDIGGLQAKVEEYRKAQEDRAKAEEDRLRSAGDFETLKAKIIADHRREVEARDKTAGELRAKLTAAEASIHKLVVSNAFASSAFISTELAIGSGHAERLFGEHFKVEEHGGAMVPVAYKDGQALVDAAGKPLAFDVAFQTILSVDPDKGRLLKPKAKPGAGSSSEGSGKGGGGATTEVRGVDRIAKALADQKK